MLIGCRRFLATGICLLPKLFISTAMGQEEKAFQWIVFSDTLRVVWFGAFAGAGNLSLGQPRAVHGR